MSRLVATGREPRQERQGAATSPDQSRQVATGDARYVARLENDNEFLRDQLAVKDKTIDALLERDREPSSFHDSPPVP